MSKPWSTTQLKTIKKLQYKCSVQYHFSNTSVSWTRPDKSFSIRHHFQFNKNCNDSVIQCWQWEWVRNYEHLNANVYACLLRINNPNGLNNFTDIDGAHLMGYSDGNVDYIINSLGSVTTNIPSIICNKFYNVSDIYLRSAGIQRINEYSFRNCSKLTNLSIFNNTLTEIDENSFIGNEKLKGLAIENDTISTLRPNLFKSLKSLSSLVLDYTDFQELLNGIFTSLVNLFYISMNGNILRNISSSAYEFRPNLKIARFVNNQISAIDEKFIENTGINYIDLTGNLCINRLITDGSASRSQIKQLLKACFDNFSISPTTVVPFSNTTPRKASASNMEAQILLIYSCKLFVPTE